MILWSLVLTDFNKHNSNRQNISLSYTHTNNTTSTGVYYRVSNKLQLPLSTVYLVSIFQCQCQKRSDGLT